MVFMAFLMKIILIDLHRKEEAMKRKTLGYTILCSLLAIIFLFLWHSTNFITTFLLFPASSVVIALFYESIILIVEGD
jgi:uncharacterized membrane protein